MRASRRRSDQHIFLSSLNGQNKHRKQSQIQGVRGSLKKFVGGMKKINWAPIAFCWKFLMVKNKERKATSCMKCASFHAEFSKIATSVQNCENFRSTRNCVQFV